MEATCAEERYLLPRDKSAVSCTEVSDGRGLYGRVFVNAVSVYLFRYCNFVVF